jgi:ribosomal-protein-alanine N-acetyltransferase
MTIEFPRLRTPRVELRLLTLADEAVVFRHFSDPDVTRYMDIDPCPDVAAAREIITFHLEDSGCRWGLFCRASGILIGTCGYHGWVPTRPAKAEIGFDLAKAYWGMGLMREVLPPVLAFGFEGMGLERIEATVEPENARCIALLEGLGFDVERDLRERLRVFFVEQPGPEPHRPSDDGERAAS